MQTLRWTNPGQPQTLQMGVFLSYFRGVFIVLFLGSNTWIYKVIPLDLLGSSVARMAPVLLAGGLIAGGLGIASERKWGLIVGRIAASYAVISCIYWMIRIDFGFSVAIRMMFDSALLVLLLHQQSREYARIWFK
jgi:hypothetical protein